MDDAQPTLFDSPPVPVAVVKPGAERDYAPPLVGRYSGPAPTATERASGEAVEERESGPLRRGSAGHVVLAVYADGERMTAYDASFRAIGEWHARRRESTRLYLRGFLAKDGELPNRAPLGRGAVDAYRITAAGLAELARLA